MKILQLKAKSLLKSNATVNVSNDNHDKNAVSVDDRRFHRDPKVLQSR